MKLIKPQERYKAHQSDEVALEAKSKSFRSARRLARENRLIHFQFTLGLVLVSVFLLFQDNGFGFARGGALLVLIATLLAGYHFILIARAKALIFEFDPSFYRAINRPKPRDLDASKSKGAYGAIYLLRCANVVMAEQSDRLIAKLVIWEWVSLLLGTSVWGFGDKMFDFLFEGNSQC